jgi:GxxExxY protein
MALGELFEERLTHSVIGAFFEVYNNLGFGFLEHIYVMALERELLERNHRVAREVAVRVLYKGHELGEQRLDMIVDDKLVVETKSTFELHKSANRQVYNYLRSTHLENRASPSFRSGGPLPTHDLPQPKKEIRVIR